MKAPAVDHGGSFYQYVAQRICYGIACSVSLHSCHIIVVISSSRYDFELRYSQKKQSTNVTPLAPG